VIILRKIDTTTTSGITDHSELNELDYASSGHVGFAPTVHNHTESNITDLDKYTQTEVDTISGSLSTEIDSDISTHSSSADHDGRYYTESEVDVLIASSSGTTDHSVLDNLDYASSGHTGFSPTSHSHTELDISDLDKYTVSEVDTISGSLQTNIDGKPDTLLELTDTPESYANGLYLQSTTDGTEWATVSGGAGVENHSELNELDYASSGHTGFSPDIHLHDDRYYTESEVDALTSGTGQTGQYHIDNGVNNFTVSFDTNYDDIEYDVVGVLFNSVDATPAEYGYIITETTVSGFDVELSDITDSGNYKFNWRAGSVIGGGGTGAGASTLLELTDTPSSYSSGLYLKSTADGTEWATASGGSGTSNHSELNELDYVSAGHTGFQPSGDYLEQDGTTQLTDNWNYGSNSISGTGDIYCNDIYTASGTVYIGNLKLSTDGTDLLVDGKVHHSGSHTVASHSDTTATGAELDELTGASETSLHTHDDRYYTESEVDTISGSLQTNIDDKADTGHNHTASDVSDFSEATDDRVNNLLTAGDNISLDYNDVAGTLTISGSAGGGAETLLELTDTPASYDDGKYLKSTADGTEWATVSGGSGADHNIADHLDTSATGAELNELTDGSETTLHSHAGGGTTISGMVDNTIVRGDGTDSVQSTGITISDTDDMVLPATSSLACPEKLVIPLNLPASLENGCIWIA
jgi:hypothetical protein